jgi:intracellular sulfur oxidation DsrE/DsrF family protein
MLSKGWLAVGLFGLGLALAVAQARTGAGGPEGDDEPRVIVHVNFADGERQGMGLMNVANILKQTAGAGRIEVVCHGPGISLVEKAKSSHAEVIALLVKQGVRFIACENTMRQRSIAQEDLLPDVGTVPSGAWEVVRRQQKDGYAYFKP